MKFVGKLYAIASYIFLHNLENFAQSTHNLNFFLENVLK